MPLSGFYYQEFWAVGENTTYTQSGTVNLNSSYVRATVALQVVNEDSNGVVQAAIVEYVQNGVPHNGIWQEVVGPGITSVSWGLTVTNAYGQGTLNVDIFT